MTPGYKAVDLDTATLTKCGGPTYPDGSVAVDFAGGIPYNAYNPAGVVTTGTCNNPEDTAFFVRSISIWQDLDTYGQIQWPDGLFLSNQQCSLAGSAWFGQQRRLLTKERAIKPGESITITTNPIPTQGPAQATNVSIVFGGVWRYLLTGGNLQPLGTQHELERYVRNTNQNILAPELALDAIFEEIPPGFKRQPYILQSQPSAQISAPGGSVSVEIPVSQSYDFLVRAFTIEPVAGSSGTVTVKRRDASGYSLDTDYIPVGLVQNAPLAKFWCIRRGVNLFVDFQVSGLVGVGTYSAVVNVLGQRQVSR